MAKKRVHEIAKEQGLTSKEVLAKLNAAGIEAKAAASSVEEADALAALGNGAAPAEGKAAAKAAATATKSAKPKADAPAEPAATDGEPPADQTRPPPAGHRPASPKQRPTRDPLSGARPPGPGPGGRPRGAIDSPAPPRQMDGPAPAPPPASPKQRPTRDSLSGERAPGAGAGGRRRVVIDSQASRRQMDGPPPAPPRRQRRRHRRRGTYDEVAAATPAPRPTAPDVIRINSGSTVKETAESLGVAVPEVIKKLMSLGEMATLTQTLSDEALGVLAEEFGKKIEIVHAADDVEVEPTFEDAEADLLERPPVVTIMGHVDHGKTSLLDAIRQTEVVASEAGGITQHIGAYQVHHNGKTVTFLDTPGHEAFTAMRARGAGVTDIAVIVVAADDGPKPQTDEAIDHARAADVPIIAAVNKIDKDGADPTRVRTEMTQLDLQPAEWGGETEFVDVSAKTKVGLDDLLDTIQVVAELEELKANPTADASGVVIESKLDPGRGPVVTILVQLGTLEVGAALVAGAQFGKVRAMSDFVGEKVKRAGPGEPVEVLGFDGVPEAGEFVHVVENDRRARALAGERANRLKTEALARRSRSKVSLEGVV